MGEVDGFSFSLFETPFRGAFVVLMLRPINSGLEAVGGADWPPAATRLLSPTLNIRVSC